MIATNDSTGSADTAVALDGFDVLDVCHRQTVFTLGKLRALVARLSSAGPDEEAREMAAEIVLFFSTTARRHHEEEERHVFPKMAGSDDPKIVQAVLTLQQDHHWLEEDWRELSVPLDAVACGQSWYDLDVLRKSVEVFVALSHEHIALEESLIYPQARARLDAAQRHEMGREISARRRAQRSVVPAPGGSEPRG
ncbi:MAG: hemerythrin domain-containing protein [Burkholderiaceae bacterium]